MYSQKGLTTHEVCVCPVLLCVWLVEGAPCCFNHHMRFGKRMVDEVDLIEVASNGVWNYRMQGGIILVVEENV
jgi:hypothetical protein